MTASIEWLVETRGPHLRTDGFSYVIGVLESGALGTVHLGAPLRSGMSHRALRPGEFHGFANCVGHPVALEYPTPGSGDYRIPALVVEQADGSSVLDLRYVSHRIFAGKAAIQGLPSTYVEADDEAQSVEVLLRDDVSSVEVVLSYTVFRDVPAIARSARIRNGGSAPVRITTAMSAVHDLADADWNLVTLSGTGAGERHVVERALVPGRQSVSTTRGASSSQHNPFM